MWAKNDIRVNCIVSSVEWVQSIFLQNVIQLMFK